MDKINIAEILKDCPKGMELYSPLCGKCVFDHINMGTIICKKQNNQNITFTSRGYYMLPVSDDCECMIFPSKDQRDWNKFHRSFKDGDIVTWKDMNTLVACIYKERISPSVFSYYIALYKSGLGIIENGEIALTDDKLRFASEEEKLRLFFVIKENGYKWNPETKTLEKITRPNFKVGDWVTDGVSKCQIYFIDGTRYWYSENCILGSIESVDKRYHLWTINDAKDGDVLFHSDSASNGIFIFKEILQCGTIEKVVCHCDYDSEDGFCLGENHACCWTDSKILYPATKKRCDLLFKKIKEAGYKWNPETKTLEKLIKEKFDITTLKPFDKVLVRQSDTDYWKPALWGKRIISKSSPFITSFGQTTQAIPFKNNEWLVGTTEDCDNYYKTWL